MQNFSTIQAKMAHLVAHQSLDAAILFQTLAGEIIYSDLKEIILSAGQISLSKFLELKTGV